MTYDALAQLKDGPREPKLGESKDTQRNNEDYSSETVDLEKQKAELKDSLYGGEEEDVEEPVNTLSVDEVNNTRELMHFEEHPHFPIIKRFTQLPGISVKNSDILEMAKVFNDKKAEKLSMDTFKDVEMDSSLRNYLGNYIAEIDRLNPEKELNSDQKVEVPKEFESISVLEDQENPVVQLLAKNYTRIPDGEQGSPDFEKDLDTSFEITLNKLIEGKNFQRTDSFDLAVEDIKNGDVETKFAALNYIYSLVNTKEGLKGAKSKTSFDKIKNTNKEKKVKYLNFKINQLSKQIEKTQDGEEKNKFNKELEELEKLKDEDDFGGEVFSGSEVEKIQENDPLSNLENN